MTPHRPVGQWEISAEEIGRSGFPFDGHDLGSPKNTAPPDECFNARGLFPQCFFTLRKEKKGRRLVENVSQQLGLKGAGATPEYHGS